tara:strand:+ start:297 stop:437 length:141 start_codon:yes stop_codon:yes gene_type:complete
VGAFAPTIVFKEDGIMETIMLIETYIWHAMGIVGVIGVLILFQKWF